MQASGARLGMWSVFKHLIMDEGLLRFWKGAHVMASGCIPSHASYFLCYETLKDWWHLENEEFEVTKSMMIGSCTTFLHDFFITPADGKCFIIHLGSGEATTTAVQESNCLLVRERHSSTRGILPRSLPIVFSHGWHERAICKLRGLH
jgi:hypothetical protein